MQFRGASRISKYGQIAIYFPVAIGICPSLVRPRSRVVVKSVYRRDCRPISPKSHRPRTQESDTGPTIYLDPTQPDPTGPDRTQK